MQTTLAHFLHPYGFFIQCTNKLFFGWVMFSPPMHTLMKINECPQTYNAH
jgi:hypothetical protein